MTRQEIAQLACKIMALWLFTQAALSLDQVTNFLIVLVPEALSAKLGVSGLAGLGVSGMNILGMVAIGVLLWWQSRRIGARMVSSDPTPVTAGRFDQRAIMSVAVAAVGVFIAVETLPKIAQTLFLLVREEWAMSQFRENERWQTKFWTDTAQFLLAMWCIFGSRGIGRMIQRYRGGGFSGPPAQS